MTTRGFRKEWRRRKAAYRNSRGGDRTRAWKRLRDAVTAELRREVRAA